jgi:hypothetical protein
LTIKYLEWCNKSDNDARNVKTAEFVAEFILLFMLDDENAIEKWTDEAMSLMNRYCDNSNVLSVISGRLFNGSVSVSKYQRLKQAYELLSKNSNEKIRLWAEKEAEYLDSCIKREMDEAQIREVYNK